MVGANDNQRRAMRSAKTSLNTIIGDVARMVAGEANDEGSVAHIGVTDDFGGSIRVRAGELEILRPLIERVIEDMQSKAANER